MTLIDVFKDISNVTRLIHLITDQYVHRFENKGCINIMPTTYILYFPEAIVQTESFCIYLPDYSTQTGIDARSIFK